MSNVKRIGSETAELGEGPLWSAERGSLTWFDVSGRKLWRHRPGAEAHALPLDRMPASFGWRQGGMIFAFRNGLALTDFDGAVEQEIPCTPVDFAKERFNDGAVDRQGRFWIGSFNPKVAPEAGSLYRVDHDLTVHKVETGFTMSNGLGWSPDGRTLYFADTRPGCIRAFDLDLDSGQTSNRRILIDYADTKGRPDGMTVDSEGCLWVAEVEASRIARYDPEGAFMSSLPMPVSKPTCITFGGPDYATLYITSMRLGFDAERLAAEPEAGGLFRAEPGVKGLPEPQFGEISTKPHAASA